MTPTPSKRIQYEKTKELQRLKALLENERYEKNMAEAEAKQSEEKIDRLSKSSSLLHSLRSNLSNNYFLLFS